MTLKKDKQKVLGETFDDERVRGFLDMEPRDGFNLDFIILERAYRSMKADNFTTFLAFFVEEGRDINSRNPSGESLLHIVKGHGQSQDYLTALKNAGAKI